MSVGGLSLGDSLLAIREFGEDLEWLAERLRDESDARERIRQLTEASVLIVARAAETKKGSAVYSRWRAEHLAAIEETEERETETVFDRLKRRRRSTVFDRLKYLSRR